MYLLASLPESYDMLVTALQANVDVSKMEVVTERLLHEERKMNERTEPGTVSEKAMAVRPRQKKMGPKCHYCGKLGHIKRGIVSNLLKQKRNSAPARRKEEMLSQKQTKPW